MLFIQVWSGHKILDNNFDQFHIGCIFFFLNSILGFLFSFDGIYEFSIVFLMCFNTLQTLYNWNFKFSIIPSCDVFMLIFHVCLFVLLSCHFVNFGVVFMSLCLVLPMLISRLWPICGLERLTKFLNFWPFFKIYT